MLPLFAGWYCLGQSSFPGAAVLRKAPEKVSRKA